MSLPKGLLPLAKLLGLQQAPEAGLGAMGHQAQARAWATMEDGQAADIRTPQLVGSRPQELEPR